MTETNDIFKIETNNRKPQKGRVLIAEPFLMGEYFNRSAIYLVEHNKEGTVGVILNKPISLPETLTSDKIKLIKEHIGLGGPVSSDSIYFLHTLGDKVPNSTHVLNNIYFGGDFEVVMNLLNDGIASTSEVRFFVGYSGWDKDQLREELNENSWVIGDISADLVMKEDKDLWALLLKDIGGKYSLWENFPLNPILN